MTDKPTTDSSSQWLEELIEQWPRRGAATEDRRKYLDALVERLMMPEYSDEALQFFWQRLDHWVEVDGAWMLLYNLMSNILQRGGYSHYQRLPEDPQDYIDGFIAIKIFESASKLTGNPIHVGGLRAFYRNYLLDEIRALNAGVDTEPLLEESAHRCDESDKAVPDEVLSEVGLSIAQVQRAATAWLRALRKLEDDWARVLLRCYSCAEIQDRVPVSHFKGRLRNAHYRARQLGIVNGGTQFPDFRTTCLGRWLRRLGLALESDDEPAIGMVLSILCAVVLEHDDIDCSRQSTVRSRQ